MSIYETSVRKPVTTALIFIGVIFFGLFAYNKIAVDLYPEIDAPYISVITFYSGAGAEDIENNVKAVIVQNLGTDQTCFLIQGPKARDYLSACIDYYNDCEFVKWSEIEELYKEYSSLYS